EGARVVRGDVEVLEDWWYDGVARVAKATQAPVDERLVVRGVAEGVAVGRALQRLRGGAAVLDRLARAGAIGVERELRPAVGRTGPRGVRRRAGLELLELVASDS